MFKFDTKHLLLLLCIVCISFAASGNSTSSDTTPKKAKTVKRWTTPLFTNLAEDMIGSVLAFLAVIIGQSGGVGAGGLLVPVYIAVLRLGPFAIPLSKATIFGSSIVGVIMNARRRHPKADRPVIAYEVAQILGPMTLAGTIIGVLLTTVFPSWLIIILLIILLSFTTKTTLVKGIEVWKKESVILTQNRSRVEAQKKIDPEANGAKAIEMTTMGDDNNASSAASRAIDNDDDNGNTRERVVSIPDHIATTPSTYASESPDSPKITLRISSEDVMQDQTTNSTVIADADQERLRKVAAILHREKKASWPVIGLMSFTWVVVLMCAMLKGGHGTDSIAGIACGSGGYWSVVFGSFFIITFVSGFCSFNLNKEFKLKKEIKYPFAIGDTRWSVHNTMFYPVLCIVAGLAAGLLGIGAGMIQSPMMLEMGVLPEISSATAMFMVFFTSSSTAVQFLLLGTLRYDYALWYGGVGMLGAIAGQHVTDVIVHKYKRVSVMVFAVTLVTGLSVVAMGVEGILGVVDNLKAHNSANLRFQSLC